MLEKDSFEQFKFIAETHRKALDTRREYEWKTLTMTVAFYVLAAAATYADDFHIPNLKWAYQIAWVVSLSVCVLSITYLLMLHRANDDNKGIAEAAENLIIDSTESSSILNARNKARNRRTQNRKGARLILPAAIRHRWSFIWQAITIFAFAITATHLALIAPDVPPTNAPTKSSAG